MQGTLNARCTISALHLFPFISSSCLVSHPPGPGVPSWCSSAAKRAVESSLEHAEWRCLKLCDASSTRDVFSTYRCDSYVSSLSQSKRQVRGPVICARERERERHSMYFFVPSRETARL